MRIGICTGGGDCPGLNAAIRAAVKHMKGNYGYEAVGIRDSFNGLMERPQKYGPLNFKDVTDILNKGGTILGTHSSGNPFADSVGSKEAIRNTIEGLRLANLEAVLVIGGEGTQGIAALLSEHGLPLVGIPKTIDNDLPGTDVTIGFSTATDIVREATERLHSTAESHDRIMVLEVMGRNSGSIALEGGLAGGAHAILIPEIPFCFEEVTKKILARKALGRKFSVVVVAEGARQKGSQDKTIPGGIGNQIALELKNKTGMETRVTVLGHIQRGGPPNINDRLLASRLATHAVDLLVNKKYGIYLGVKNNEIVEHHYSSLNRGEGKQVSLDHPYISTCEKIGVSLGRKLDFVHSL